MTTQTITPVPVPGSNFIESLQAFLRDEDAARFALMVAYGSVVSGGLHSTVPGLTATPTPLTAFPGGFYITEVGSITYPDAQTTYVIAGKDVIGDLGAYLRVAGTHYLIANGVTAPTLPAECVRLMTVTTAGGAITAVDDVRQGSALIARFAQPYMRLIGLTSDTDIIIQEADGNLVVGINTRTEDWPLHTPRLTFIPSLFNLILHSGITEERTQTFPDKDGTFAMLSDIAGSAFAPGTRMLFDNDTAPTGWVRVAGFDDYMVRIVAGARADGGSWTVSGLTALGHALTIAEMPAHTHPAPNGAAFSTTDPQAIQVSGAGPGGVAAATDTTGGGAQHTHNVLSDGNWRPLHRDVILASKT